MPVGGPISAANRYEAPDTSPSTSRLVPAVVSTRISRWARPAPRQSRATIAARPRRPLPDNSDGLPSALRSFIVAPCAVSV